MISTGNKSDVLATTALKLFIELGLINPAPAPVPANESTALLAEGTAAADPRSARRSIARIISLLDDGNYSALVCPVRCSDGITRNLHEIYEKSKERGANFDYHLRGSFVFSAAAKALLSAIWSNIGSLIDTCGVSLGDHSDLHKRVTNLQKTRQAMLRNNYQDAQIALYLTELNIKYPSQIAYDSSRNYNFCAQGTSLACGTSLVTGLSLLCAHLYIPSAIFGGLCAASCMYSATDAVCYAPKRMTCLEAWCLAKPIDIPSVVREIKQNLLVVDDVLAQQPTS